MSTRAHTPALSPGNHIYLYRLLRDALGAGKQTFLPAVEEALAAEGFGAEDLGFESTRALLEELGDFVTLKIFKGNRVYATIVAQPAWDEALAAGDTDRSGSKAGGKSWKRKKADKTLRAVKPRRVRRPEPEPAAAAEPAAEPEPTAEPASEPEPAPAHADAPSADGAAPEKTPEDRPTAADGDTPTAAPADGTAPDGASVSDGARGDAPAAAAETTADAADGSSPASEARGGEDRPAPTAKRPSISLTILYDPTESGSDGFEGATVAEHDASPAEEPAEPREEGVAAEKRTDASLPAEPAREQGPEHAATAVETTPEATPAAPAPEVAPAPAASPAPGPAAVETAAPEKTPAPETAPEHSPAPAAASDRPGEGAPQPVCETQGKEGAQAAPVADYPVDFAREVYCPGDLLLTLTHLLPYGADVLGILSAYFDIARLNGTLEGTRSRATFPLSYIREGERSEVLVTIKRRSPKALRGSDGALWAIASVEHE